MIFSINFIRPANTNAILIDIVGYNFYLFFMKTSPSFHNSDLIIFTDLDGAMLNHSDYAYVEAKHSLAFIRKNSAPLAICADKTRSEVRNLKNEIGLNDT